MGRNTDSPLHTTAGDRRILLPPGSGRRRGSGHPLIVAGAIIAVVVVVLAALLSRGGGTPPVARSSSASPPSSPAPSPPAGVALLRIDPGTNQVAPQSYSVGDDPTAVAVGDGSVWVANAGDHTILGLDPATGEVQATIHLSQQPRAIAGGGVPGVWVATIDELWEIDPRTNAVVLTHDLGDATGTVTTGEGSVWVTGLLFGLGKVDPATGLLDPHFVGPVLCTACHILPGQLRKTSFFFSGDHQRGAPPSVAAGLGSVWAIVAPPPTGPSSLWRIDPLTGASKSITVPSALIGVTVGRDAVWAVGTNGEVVRVDPKTDEVTTTIVTGYGATKLAAGLDAIWVLNPARGMVVRIDPQTNTVVGTIAVGAGAKAIAVGLGSVWVTVDGAPS
jgi:streptogramin lyase